MASWKFNEQPLAVEPCKSGSLRAAVFTVYRRIARARQEAQKALNEARREREEAETKLRRRLANVAASVFHLERSVATMREPLRCAGLQRELDRLEIMLKMFEGALRDNGVTVRSLDGIAIDGEMADVIEVLSTVPVNGGGGPHVHETVEPMVEVDGAVARFARVIATAPRGPPQ